MRLTQTAQQSIRFRQLTSAFDCLTRAANLGDRDARTAVGIMYRDGVGTKVSYPDALRYLKQSAIQDEYNAEVALSQMYDIGVGVPASPVQAQDWARRARQNPLYIQAVRDRQVEDDNRHMAFLGLTALVEAMAAPSVYVVR